MSNPNNCSTCDHKKHPDGGHCYMFRFAPTEPCMQHSVRFESARNMRMAVLQMSRFVRTAGKAQP